MAPLTTAVRCCISLQKSIQESNVSLHVFTKPGQSAIWAGSHGAQVFSIMVLSHAQNFTSMIRRGASQELRGFSRASPSIHQSQGKSLVGRVGGCLKVDAHLWTEMITTCEILSTTAYFAVECSWPVVRNRLGFFARTKHLGCQHYFFYLPTQQNSLERRT